MTSKVDHWFRSAQPPPPPPSAPPAPRVAHWFRSSPPPPAPPPREAAPEKPVAPVVPAAPVPVEEKKKAVPSVPIVPVVPSEPAALPAHTTLPARRSMVPVRMSTAGKSTPAFLEQCKKIDEYHHNTLKVALQVVKTSPFLKQREKSKGPAEVKQITSEKMTEVYRKIPVIDFDEDQERLYFSNVTRQSPLNAQLRFTAKPCSFGNDCLAVTMAALPLEVDLAALTSTRSAVPPTFVPGPLMQYYTSDELVELYTTGVSPLQSRACLVCTRFALGNAVICADTEFAGWPPSVMLQFFGNEVDRPQGYRRDICLMPDDSGFNGLYYPLAQDVHDLQCLRWDPLTRGYYIDQRAMAAKEHTIEADYPRQIWDRIREKSSNSFRRVNGKGARIARAKPADFRTGAAPRD